ncbi:hypothetical protein TBLA_0C02530 [Henningerozyma blattae CBS 6284]|uniref:CCZ1/INTU/HSP4 first Longin domain-containing protein n=1 Tax=Henningerozyma blattae (strain ATCC 34711 / CBS 6284 / DSM 70876 / NBRC 10599 / NRRL Y-10934 / UCD 77-7) TaxID=1071380 RepID=I2H111_HENB6|nr:hypothetical protein TBLA_0C02530 [Tetrapisispora blattae CBS 6284]CCH60063.1 hypothetical protein TBLA_0C02530 [Tetrapisispora blattae CBS 6284]
MLQYITVFDPTRSKDETDTYKQLLIFHSFQDCELSLNDKLGKIGIMQAMFSLTEPQSCNNEDSNVNENEDKERIIELDDETLLIIKIESRFFMGISFNGFNQSPNLINYKIPYNYYLSHMWYFYKFFVLENGYFSNYEIPSQLTNILNEQIVVFWDDIYNKPEIMLKKGLSCMWPESYRVSNIEIHDNENSWESIINQEILLDAENFLGIKDILVYQLPDLNQKKKILKIIYYQKTVMAMLKYNRINSKTYGLVRNFTSEFQSLCSLSNWIYHLHALHEKLTSSILAGTTSFNDFSGESVDRSMGYVSSINNKGHGIIEAENVGRSTDSNEHQLQESRNNNSSAAKLANKQSFGYQAKNVFYNMALPITFAYDAVQEVGATTGVSNSMSLITDYIPFLKYGKEWEENELNRSQQEIDEYFHSLNKNNYGYLISPSFPKNVSINYKVRKMLLNFSSNCQSTQNTNTSNQDMNNSSKEMKNLNEKYYNLLFWYYRDTLVVIICDLQFNKIWEQEYLKKLELKLLKSLSRFYETMFDHDNKKKASQNSFKKEYEDFGYMRLDKTSNPNNSKGGMEMNISIPSWVYYSRANLVSKEESSSSESAIEGIFPVNGNLSNSIANSDINSPTDTNTVSNQRDNSNHTSNENITENVQSDTNLNAPLDDQSNENTNINANIRSNEDINSISHDSNDANTIAPSNNTDAPAQSDEQANSYWTHGLHMMGSYLYGTRPTTNSNTSIPKPQDKEIYYQPNGNFLDMLDNNKLIEFNKQLDKIIVNYSNNKNIDYNLNKYSIIKRGIKEERLIKLNNGIICFYVKMKTKFY